MKSLKSLAPALLALALAPASLCAETVFGHEVPEFSRVFVKLFINTADVMSLEQVKETADDLSSEELSAVSDYLGEEGRAKVRESGLSENKKAFLEKQYFAAAEPRGKPFRELCPRILAVSNRNMSVDQLSSSLSSLSEEEIASMSFFLGPDGRRQLFGAMRDEKVEVVLRLTADWVLIETGKRRLNELPGYKCIVYKQERLDNEELQDVEKIEFKTRFEPRGIYMKWLEGPWKGRELLYSEMHLGPGKVRVRESGILGIVAVTLPVESELAQRGSNHMVTEIGIRNLLAMVEKDYVKAAPRGDIARKDYGIIELDGRKLYKVESILPNDPSLGYYTPRMTHYLDYMRSLETRAEVYNFRGELYEMYYYTDIDLDPGFTDRDFDPDNPEYDLD